MTTLYDLSLYRRVAGFGKPSVRSVKATGLVGHWCEERETIVTFDEAAVREALPHYYRKAFDRGRAWFPKDDNGPAYVTLYGSKGKCLNTLYLWPRQFQ